MKLDYQIIPQRIALWGPAGSGKTWLINALGRALVNFQPSDPNFSYELREFSDEIFDPFIMPIAPPKYQPTNELVDYMWLFRRRAKQNTYAHKISAQTHILHIHDVNGLESIALADGVKQNYINAKLILLLLDPINLDKFPVKIFDSQTDNDQINKNNTQIQNVFESKDAQSMVMTRELYQSSIKQLLDYVSESGNVRPFVAVCLTKRDLWKKDLSSDEAVRSLFGQQMFDMLSQYSRELTLKTFIMTSCGYLDDASKKSNYNKQTGELLDISQWIPRGVLNPFFWFLDCVERQKLDQTKFFFENLIGRNRSKTYISYPSSIDESLL